MAFSDARNERDRAAGDTSGRSSGGGGDRARQAEARNRAAMFGGGFGGAGSGARGTLAQQQDRLNQANARSVGNIAPGVKEGFVSGMGGATARRTVNPTPSYPLTARNVWEALKALPLSGFGAVNILGGALGVPGMGPSFEGPMGMANTPGDYDPTNRFGTPNSGLYTALAQNGPMGGQQGQVTPATPLAGAPANPYGSAGPTSLSVPGQNPYGLMMPGYRWNV